MRPPLRGTAVFLACAAGCLASSKWDTAASLPRELKPEAVLALGPADALVGGGLPASPDLGSFATSAAIYRVSGSSWEAVYSRPNGAVYAFADDGRELWALLREQTATEARAGIALLASSDRGRTWRLVGPVPEHAWRLAAGASGLWVYGVDTLLRSTDGGTTWTRLAVPAGHDSYQQRLVVLEDGTTFLAGDGVSVFDPATGAVSRRMDASVKLLAADGRLVVTRSADGRNRVGRLNGAADAVEEWLAELPAKWTPFDLAVTGQQAWVLALKEANPMPTGGIALAVSADGGRTFKHATVGGRAWYEFADVGPNGAGVTIGYENEVRTPGARR